MAAGGKRKGAGRKSKAEEQQLVERLSPLAPKAFKALEQGLDDNQNWAVKLFMEYSYGKPKESININPDNNFEIPLTTFFGVRNK
jgi:hypothetical protein